MSNVFQVSLLRGPGFKSPLMHFNQNHIEMISGG